MTVLPEMAVACPNFDLRAAVSLLTNGWLSVRKTQPSVKSRSFSLMVSVLAKIR